MPLSEQEMRLLDEIEQALINDDPTFASSIGSGRSRSRSRIAPAMYAVGILLGIGCVVCGLIAASGIGAAAAVIGFILIVVSCLRAWRRRRSEPPHRSTG
jgi:hypothetical protein